MRKVFQVLAPHTLTKRIALQFRDVLISYFRRCFFHIVLPFLALMVRMPFRISVWTIKQEPSVLGLRCLQFEQCRIRIDPESAVHRQYAAESPVRVFAAAGE
jgi:hypothetical protein